MAFDDAALERALRAETKGGLTLCGGVSELTVIGCGWRNKRTTKSPPGDRRAAAYSIGILFFFQRADLRGIP